jgi:hypothetical protein
MKIYVASSWRNGRQQEVVAALRAAGHEVYDFRHPAPGVSGFAWSDIDPEWQAWDSERFRAALDHPIAREGFRRDMAALALCDACVLVMPCGRSAHLELGYAIGSYRRTAILLEAGEPELMYRMVDALCTDLGELLQVVDEWTRSPAVAHCRACGCTDDDCRGCIERTGEPCHWVAEDLCSACADQDRTYLLQPDPGAPRLPSGVTTVVAEADGAKLGSATWWDDEPGDRRMAITVPRGSETDLRLQARVSSQSALPWLRYDPQRGVAVLGFPPDPAPAAADGGARP